MKYVVNVIIVVCLLCTFVVVFLVHSKLGLPMTPRRESGDVMDTDKCSTLDVYQAVSHMTGCVCTK